LDTGCGTGSLIEKAAAEFTDTKFLLLDPSEGMIKKAPEKSISPRKD